MPRRLLMLTAMTLCLSSAAAAEARLPLSVVEDDAQLLGSDPLARGRALDDWRSLGADVVRIMVVWRRATEDPQLLQALDEAVTGARARGLEVLLDVTGPGPASASRCLPQRPACDPDPAAFAAWVAQVARRYPGVRRWSIWNEPNNPTWLTPQHARDGTPLSPRRYRRLVEAAIAALRRAGHGHDHVLAGETAPMPGRGSAPPAERPVAADRFLELLLSGHRPLDVDGIAHHPYPTDLSSPYGDSGAQQFTLAGLHGLRRLVARAVARRVLPARPQVWLTEFGLQTDPPDRVFGIPTLRQAVWLARAERRAATEGATAMAQYLLVDEPRLSSFQSGLRDADGRAKPSFGAYRLPLVATAHRSSISLWGRVRPLRRAGAPVQLELRSPSRRTTTIRTRTGQDGVVELRLRPRRGYARLAWTDPAAHARRHGAWIALPRPR